MIEIMYPLHLLADVKAAKAKKVVMTEMAEFMLEERMN